MNRYISLFIFLLLAGSVNPLKAQTGEWLIYFGDYKLNEKWSIWHEAQARYSTTDFNINQFLLRTALTYWTNENESFATGLGLIDRNYDVFDEQDEEELRLYQQYFKRWKLSGKSVNLRLRTEQRFLPNTYQNRARIFVSTIVPLKKLDKGVLYFTAYDEFFVRDRGGLFDQNRVYAGLGYRFGSYRIETAFMLQSFSTYTNRQINLVLFNTF